MAGKRKDSKGRILRTGESQRPDGRYCYKYVGTDGKPKFLYAWKLEPTDRTPKGKRDGPSLREQEKEAQRDQLDGIDHSGANMTVSELYARHINLKPNVKPNTVLGRERRKKMLEDDPLGSCRISSVKQSDAKAWAVRMKSKGVAYNSIRSDKSALKAAFRTAVNDDLVRKNPFDFKLVDVIENDTERKQALTPEQEKDLLEFIRQDPIYRRYYDDVLILLGTGLRISEFCGLTRRDVDLENNVLSIDHQLLKNISIGRYVGDPKSHSGIRKIYMGPEVQAAFKRVLERPGTCDVEIDGYSGFLFRNKNGQPRTAREYERIFRRLREKHSGALPDELTPHTLRHTFCTRMAHRNMNPKDLQYIMGHSTLSLTMEYYTHTDGNTAVAEMQRLLEG